MLQHKASAPTVRPHGAYLCVPGYGKRKVKKRSRQPEAICHGICFLYWVTRDAAGDQRPSVVSDPNPRVVFSL